MKVYILVSVWLRRRTSRPGALVLRGKPAPRPGTAPAFGSDWRAAAWADRGWGLWGLGGTNSRRGLWTAAQGLRFRPAFRWVEQYWASNVLGYRGIESNRDVVVSVRERVLSVSTRV